MPSKVISKTTTSCVNKEMCLSVCLKSCKILKNACPTGRVPSDTAEVERFIFFQNNHNESTVTTYSSDEVRSNNGNGNEAELTSNTLVQPLLADFHLLNENTEITLDACEPYLTTENHTETHCEGMYGFESPRSNAGESCHVDVPQFVCIGDYNERTESADICDVLPIDGQNRNNDRSDINNYSNKVAEQNSSFQVDEGELILSLHEENLVMMSLSCRDFPHEVLTNSDDPWPGLNLQFDVNGQDYEFEPFFLDSDRTAALDSDFFNDLPSLLDSECSTWLLSSPEDISSEKPITLVLDLDETLVHTSPKPCDGTDFSFQLDERTLYVQKRPFLHPFLERVSELFRIIIFTAGTRKYADQVLDILDPGRRLTSRRAYRDSCTFSDNGYKKDLTVLGLGVDLAKLAIVDNTPAVFHELQVHNGIPIKSWIGDPTDQELLSLLPFLETLACADDVRPLIAEKFGCTESS